MAFTLPTFNLTIAIYTGPWVGKSFRGTSPGNLAYGRRVNAQNPAGADLGPVFASNLAILLLPPLTDVRGAVLSGENDIVEIPQSSSRWYKVLAVEDIGKGFDNEHRAACVEQISEEVDATLYAGCVWPIPMP